MNVLSVILRGSCGTDSNEAVLSKTEVVCPCAVGSKLELIVNVCSNVLISNLIDAVRLLGHCVFFGINRPSFIIQEAAVAAADCYHLCYETGVKLMEFNLVACYSYLGSADKSRIILNCKSRRLCNAEGYIVASLVADPLAIIDYFKSDIVSGFSNLIHLGVCAVILLSHCVFFETCCPSGSEQICITAGNSYRINNGFCRGIVLSCRYAESGDRNRCYNKHQCKQKTECFFEHFFFPPYLIMLL